jgi:hypothetical protein
LFSSWDSPGAVKGGGPFPLPGQDFQHFVSTQTEKIPCLPLETLVELDCEQEVLNMAGRFMKIKSDSLYDTGSHNIPVSGLRNHVK